MTLLVKYWLVLLLKGTTTEKSKETSKQVKEHINEEDADFISKEPKRKGESSEEVPCVKLLKLV